MTAGYADDLLRAAARQCDGRIDAPRRYAAADNPLCGDAVEVDADDDGTRVIALAQRVRGCVFTRGSAVVLEGAVSGMAIADAAGLAAALRRDLAGDVELPPAVAALAAVRIYPARVRCALLPWEALARALGSY